MKYVVRLQFLATNNEAEYEVLLTVARVLEAKTLVVQADYQFIVSQVKGDYEVKEERMQK